MRKAYIINVGDELLIGQVTNTNASWIANQFAAQGIKVIEQRVVADNQLQMLDALKDAHKIANIVIITGGLGPTKDDITKDALSEFFHTPLKFNRKVYERIERIFSKRGREVTEAHKQQCYLPESASLLENKMGTAPGMRFDENEVITYSIPGVPYEMRYIMQEHIIPEVSSLENDTIVRSRTLLTVGKGESDISKQIEHIENALPANIKLAYLPSLGQVRLRLTVEGAEYEKVLEELETWTGKIKNELGSIIFGEGEENLASVLQKICIVKGLKLATAESCTGGNVAHQITSNAGSSDYFEGGIIAYSNKLKKCLLNVPDAILKDKGAVSEETVIAMVKGALDTLQVDLAVAISGIAGPGGGTEEKPVGTIWLAAGDKNRVISEKLFLGKDRAANIEYSTVMALNLVRRFLMGI